MFEKGLAKLGLPAKVLITCFLCVIGIGYLFSLYTVYAVHKDADAQPGLSMNDIVLTYCGDREHTALETVSLGSMATYYASDDDKSKVISWIRNGAEQTDVRVNRRPDYEERAAPCVTLKTARNRTLP